MDIAAQGKMVEQVDLDNKKEDKAANEVVDDVLASTLAITTCTVLAKECLNKKNQRQPHLASGEGGLRVGVGDVDFSQ